MARCFCGDATRVTDSRDHTILQNLRVAWNSVAFQLLHMVRPWPLLRWTRLLGLANYSLAPPTHLGLRYSLAPPTTHLQPPLITCTPKTFSLANPPVFHNFMIESLTLYVNFPAPCLPQCHDLKWQATQPRTQIQLSGAHSHNSVTHTDTTHLRTQNGLSHTHNTLTCKTPWSIAPWP